MPTRLAAIAPVHSAALLNEEYSYNLYFTEWALRDARYASFWRHHPGTKIMDCLIHEDAPTPSAQDVVLAARTTNPTIISVPDVKYDLEGTMALYHRYRAYLHDETDAELMGVPQGSNYDELIDCAFQMIAEGARVLGLHQGIKRKFGINRDRTFRDILQVSPETKFHMLGIPPTGFDFVPCEEILGVDSAKPIYQGFLGNSCTHRPMYFLELNEWITIQHLSAIHRSIASWTGLLSAMSPELLETAPQPLEESSSLVLLPDETK